LGLLLVCQGINCNDNVGNGRVVSDPIVESKKFGPASIGLTSIKISPSVESSSEQNVTIGNVFQNTVEGVGECSDNVMSDIHEKESSHDINVEKSGKAECCNSGLALTLGEINDAGSHVGNNAFSDDNISKVNHPVFPSLMARKVPSNDARSVMKDYWEEVKKSKNLTSLPPEKNPDYRPVYVNEESDMKPYVAYPELDGKTEYCGRLVVAVNEVKKGTCRSDAVKVDSGGVGVSDGQCSLAEVKDTRKPMFSTHERIQMQGDTQQHGNTSNTTATAASLDISSSHSNQKIASQSNNPVASLELPSNAAPLPDPTAVHEFGSIHTRSSFRTILMKNWRQTYWVRYGQSSLCIFRSKDDFEDWLLNPYHTQNQRDYLVKLRIDFFDEITKRNNIRGYKMTQVKSKSYGKHTAPMYQFKLERWSDLGVSLAAAFASPVEGEVKEIRRGIETCLNNCPNNGLRSIDDLIL